jgi:hypothetical protein
MDQEHCRLTATGYVAFLLPGITKVEWLATKHYHVLPIWKPMIS